MVMDEPTSERAGTPRRAQTFAGRLLPVLLFGAIVYALGSAIAGSCEDTAAVGQAGERFLAALNRGDVQAAYDQLSAHRRAAMPFATFAALTDHPAFRAHDSDLSFQPPESRADGICTLGNVPVAGERWKMQLFFIEEADGWHVHSFAIQAPANVQLGTLLEECGYWEGSRMGYSGPPVERVTPPTAL